MMLPPTPPTTVQFTPPTTHSPLQAGHNYSGVIRKQPDGLAAVVAGLKIPLGADSGLQAGQRVLVQVQAQGDHLQLTLRAAAVSTGTAVETGDPSTLFRAVLQQIGRLDLEDRLPTLLPRQTPQSAELLRALVSTLLSDRGTGKDLQQLQQILSQANQQGVLRSDGGAALSPWLSLTGLADVTAWYDLVRRARSERNGLARLAQIVRGEAPMGALATLKESLASLTRQLLDEDAFRNWLRKEGLEEGFRALTERTAERALGSDVQNLRALDQPYEFMEFPLGEEQGFRRLQLHVFSEAPSKNDPQGQAIHQTVLDLELTRLGPMWIALRAQGPQCTCAFRVMTPELATHLNRVADELRDELAGLGFPHARITATVWDGDRESALLSLLSPYQGLDLDA